MIGMKSLVPNWWRRESEGEWPMTDEMPGPGKIVPLPSVASIPQVKFADPVIQSSSAPRDPQSIIAEAAMLVNSFRQKSETDRQEIERLRIELAESVLAPQKKIDFLEKENSELRLEIIQMQNDKATLQSENMEYRRFFSFGKERNDKERQVYERFEIRAPAKKEPKPKPPKKSTEPSVAK